MFLKVFAALVLAMLPSARAAPVDVSGEYEFQRYICLDSAGKLAALVDVRDFTDTIEISGSAISEETSVGDCTVTNTGTLAVSSAGTFNAKVREGVPGGTCTAEADMIITTEDGPVEMEIQFNFVDGRRHDISGKYIRDADTGTFAFTELLPAVTVPGQTCYALYTRR